MKINALFLIAMFTLASSATLLAANHSSQPGQKITIEEIIKIWQKRMASIKSIYCKCTYRNTYHKGFFSIVEEDFARDRDGKRVENPNKDLLVEGDLTIILCNKLQRYTLNTLMWDPAERKLFKQQQDELCDGFYSKSIMNPESGKPSSHPQACVKPAKWPDFLNFLSSKPWLYTINLEGSSVFRDLQSYELSGNHVSIDGQDCIELAYEDKMQDYKRHMYLDTKRDFIVRRVSTKLKNHEVSRLDIKYDTDKSSYLPQYWSVIQGSKALNQPVSSSSYSVTEYSINKTASENDEAIAFPSGTRVRHYETDKDSSQYVILDSGKEGRRIPSRQNPKYSDLKIADETDHRYLVAIIAIALFTISTILVLVVRHHRKQVQVP